MHKHELTAEHSETPQPVDQMVLVVALDGSICDVLQAPDQKHDDTPTDLLGSSIELLWSAKQSNHFKQIIKRTVRSRQVQCVEFQHDVSGAEFESIFVPAWT